MQESTPKISVINITNRPGGIDILWANMKRQSFIDFELIICDGRWRLREQEVKDYINDPRLVYLRQSDKREGAYTNLAHADNEAFRACRGELIVCLQDYIWIGPEALAQFWACYQNNQKSLVTGVGDQYAAPSETAIENPEGAITVFSQPYTSRPSNKCWADPRKRLDQGTFYECYPQDIEFNWCAIPRKSIVELGGMDEEYDFAGFAFDNVNVALRANMIGYKCYIDQTNECMGFNHDGWWPNPLKVNRVSPAEFHMKRMKDIIEGKFPIKLNYL